MNHSPVTSPKPAPKIKDVQVLMDFPDAMRAVIDGHKVTKLEWDDPETVVWLDDKLKIKLDGEARTLLVSDGDMTGEDWVIADL